MHRCELSGAPVLAADVLALLPRLLPRLGRVVKLVAVAGAAVVGPASQTL